jgi:hypothetical protein
MEQDAQVAPHSHVKRGHYRTLLLGEFFHLADDAVEDIERLMHGCGVAMSTPAPRSRLMLVSLPPPRKKLR